MLWDKIKEICVENTKSDSIGRIKKLNEAAKIFAAIDRYIFDWDIDKWEKERDHLDKDNELRDALITMATNRETFDNL